MSPEDALFYESRIVLKVARRLTGAESSNDFSNLPYNRRNKALKTASRIVSDLFNDKDTVGRFVNYASQSRSRDEAAVSGEYSPEYE